MNGTGHVFCIEMTKPLATKVALGAVNHKEEGKRKEVNLYYVIREKCQTYRLSAHVVSYSIDSVYYGLISQARISTWVPSSSLIQVG